MERTEDHRISVQLVVASSMNTISSDIEMNTRWHQRPSGSSWDPALAVRWGTEARVGGRFVPLDSLLSSVGQGVFVGREGEGDLAVRLIRVSDLHPLLIGDGEVGRVAASAIRRHLAVDGDVLISRVGRMGRVGCVTHATESLVPRAGLFFARPINKVWGPAIAAALCTEHVREKLNGLLVGTRSASLTIEQLSEVPIPSPRHFDFAEVDKLVDTAGELVKGGCEILDRVRGHVGMMLEGAPTEPTERNFTWVAEPDWLQGWGWSDVQRYLLVSRLRLRAASLVRLGDVIDVDASRAKTVEAAGKVRALESDDVRPDWYLALPTTNPAGPDELEDTTARTTPKRFFEVDRESLLIPTVGNIAGAPVVVPEELLGQSSGPLLVPSHWLPLEGLRFPRALAVVLDHPFVRLQRRLAGAFSTVTHITREDIGNLLVPSPPAATWQEWEAQLCRAQDMFMVAAELVRQAVTTVEGWYK